MVYLGKILHIIHFNTDTDMLNGDEFADHQSSGFLSFNENAHVINEYMCDKNQ